MPEWVTTSDEVPSWLEREADRGDPETPCLVIAWSAEEPGRVGEFALLGSAGTEVVLGRGGATSDDRRERLRFLRRRGTMLTPTDPLRGAGISRAQCLLTATDRGIKVLQLGRAALSIDGAPARS